jgi:hypothetical protein
MSSMNMNICDSYAVGKPRACIRSNMVALPESEPVMAWTQRPQGGRPDRPYYGSGTLFGRSPIHPTSTASSTSPTTDTNFNSPPTRNRPAWRVDPLPRIRDGILLVARITHVSSPSLAMGAPLIIRRLMTIQSQPFLGPSAPPYRSLLSRTPLPPASPAPLTRLRRLLRGRGHLRLHHQTRSTTNNRHTLDYGLHVLNLLPQLLGPLDCAS